jgi:hypothetical protein
LNNAPMYGLAIPGLLLMFRSDRRHLGLVAIVLYAVTAGVNANSDFWRFGYCYASRFLITTLPALIVPMAVVLDRGVKRTPFLLVLFWFGVAIGLDTSIEALRLPESAYLGKHLNDRTISSLYPIGIHFANLAKSAYLPWTDMAIWGAIATLPILILKYVPRPALVLGVFGLVFPSIAVMGIDYDQRIKQQTPARLETIDPTKTDPWLIEMRKGMSTRNGTDYRDGTYTAETDFANRGLVGYSALPTLVPSVYGMFLPYQYEPEGASPVGGYYLTIVRTNVRAYGNHEIRHAAPLVAGGQLGANRLVRTDGKNLLYQGVVYHDEGTLTFGETNMVNNLVPIVEEHEEVFRREMNLPKEGERGFTFSLQMSNLGPGFYRVYVEIEDVDWSVWLNRKADPLVVVLYKGDPGEARKMVRAWVPMLGKPAETVPPPGTTRPRVEAYLGPHWATVPLVGQEEMQLEFENDRKQDYFIWGVYSGEFELKLEAIRVERRHFMIREDGEMKPFSLVPNPS